MTDKRKILLIYPGNKTWGFTYPIGLLYVAQSLTKAGYDVALLHLGTGTLDDLKSGDYLFAGITMMVGEMVGKGLEAARRFKELNPGVPVVFGGVYPSIMPEQVLANPLADIVVIGEGEVTARELAGALAEKGDLGKVQGLAYKAGGKVVTTEPRPPIDMETLDFDLPYHLLGSIFARSTVVPIHTSRGCPYRCGFCYSPIFNKRKYRSKSARKVADEIEYVIKKYGIRHFNFDYEDEFFVNPDRAVEIFETVLARGLKIRWTAFCRFDSFCAAYEKYGERFLRLLKDSGCFYLSFGAESGSQRLLDEVIKKDIKVEQIYTTVQALKSHRIIHRLSFINCFPGETRADMEETFKVIDRISEDNRYLVLGVFNLIPLPKTPIMELLQRAGYKPPDTMEGWAGHIPVKREIVTWHEKDYADYCFDVAKLCPVPFHQDFPSYASYKDYMKTSSDAYVRGWPAYLVARLQRLRYKKRYFRHNYEIVLFNKALRAYTIARNYALNSILKKYLPGGLFAYLKKTFGRNDWSDEQR
ncbi:MAG: radical SAM protein [Elusimicrobiales bacterium]|nr:radical SAM protein [Elusimicrobiales bacterium]